MSKKKRFNKKVKNFSKRYGQTTPCVLKCLQIKENDMAKYTNFKSSQIGATLANCVSAYVRTYDNKRIGAVVAGAVVSKEFKNPEVISTKTTKSFDERVF